MRWYEIFEVNLQINEGGANTFSSAQVRCAASWAQTLDLAINWEYTIWLSKTQLYTGLACKSFFTSSGKPFWNVRQNFDCNFFTLLHFLISTLPTISTIRSVRRLRPRISSCTARCPLTRHPTSLSICKSRTNTRYCSRVSTLGRGRLGLLRSTTVSFCFTTYHLLWSAQMTSKSKFWSQNRGSSVNSADAGAADGECPNPVTLPYIEQHGKA